MIYFRCKVKQTVNKKRGLIRLERKKFEFQVQNCPPLAFKSSLPRCQKEAEVSKWKTSNGYSSTIAFNFVGDVLEIFK